MASTGINSNIYSVKPADSVQFGGFTATRPGFSATKIPEIKDTFNKRNNAANDGKFSFLEFGKNVVKGTGQFFTDIYKSIVENPFISVPLMIVGAAMASTPLGFAVLTGAGIAGSIFGFGLLGIKAACLISGKKWDDLEKEGNNLGKIITGSALSALGAVKAVRSIENISKAGKTSTVAQSLRKAFTYDGLSWNFMKNGFMAPFRRFKFTAPMKKDYGKFVDSLANKPLFTTKEAEFLNLKDTKLFDWKFSQKLQAIQGLLTGRAGS
ncbi:MAG: hypothetical protein A2Y25_04360 [Candidatus Melainabacteria bacterium GWF2_37_15]|nr:MAG: hypothetical protein A2Y25_04360 [Candidatus Melainabacteria bacterium GWF2_37_15]